METFIFFLNTLKKFVTFETYKQKPKVFECVRHLLIDLAQKANPDMTILEFIELGETARDYIVLLVVLEPLKIIVDKLPPKRGYSLMWCFVMIEQRLKRLPAARNSNLESQEVLLLECEPNVLRTVHIYKCIEPFYSYFASKVGRETDVVRKKEKRFITRSIITILGHPLIYNAFRKDGQSKNESRVISENLVNNLSCVSNDLLKYLAYTDEINTPKVRRKIPPNTKEDSYDGSATEETNEGLFDVDDEIPVLGLGVLYYLIIGENEFEELLPHVYSPLYIFHKGLSLSSELIKRPELEVIYKGLVLAEGVIGKVFEASVSSWQVETETHLNFLDSLQPVMIFCPAEGHRRLAIRVLGEYLSVLDRKCQYLLFIHLFSTVSDLGTIAFLVTYIKDIVSSEMKQGGPISPYFKGRMLQTLVQMFCVLPEGEKTDLIKHMAPINAVLNFIRFIILRDKYDETGFRSCVPQLKQVFLVPLQVALKLSKHHFTLQLELESRKKPRKCKIETDYETEISVTVSGKTVIADRIGSIEFSLTHFDLMDSLLCRVNECLESVEI